ncbi:hypothetical protein LTS15_003661 [Exophiala xenobiotica]|nr:hypothetical protein LTS15_003661 [Exophiala xenobiotica]
MYHLTNSVKERKVSEAGRQENGDLDPGIVRDHVQSGKEIMTERTENATRLSDHPNLRVDGDMHAPDHSKPASQRHREEVDRKIDQGEIADPGRKRSV